MGVGRKPELAGRVAEITTAVRDALKLDPYPTQLAAARHLLEGRIVELDTGEGKTLAGAIGAALRAQAGPRVWIATANDYLASRDAEWMRPVYERLGLRVGSVVDGLPQPDRRSAYQCDIVYGTLREFGFDYLRSRLAERVAPGEANSPAALSGIDPFQNALIVDEADSLLIDEARTPLIISHAGTQDADDDAALRWCALHAQGFVAGRDYELQEGDRAVALSETGRTRLLTLPGLEGSKRVSLDELMIAMERAIMVNFRYLRDRDYVVSGDQLLIVDEFTGRASEGRTWSEGIHQAIEAREGLPLTPRTRTAAQITVQDFVCRFRALAGMTGTAMESSHEFRAVYGTRTQRIEPRQPSRRSELSTVVLQSTAEKWRAVAEDAQRERSVGRAVLVGTRTVEASEALSEECTRIGLDHVVLSARHPDREAAIVAEAGEPGRVTIATNMAGRGTDIRIADSVRAAGGLHVIGTERHASARIDRQLAGRCARQGDPGTHRWFLSTEDEILLLARSRSGGGKASSSASLTEVDFRNAQRTVERRYERDRLMLRLMNADTLKHYETLGLDPVVDRIE